MSSERRIVPRSRRAMEDVKCNARVVHVDRVAGRSGRIGVGAAIECFECMSVARHWDN
jgi:N-acetylmuramic acid 6-phosphate (MurNAc-6-P) etherase